MIPVLFVAVFLFLGSITLGICAMGFTALTFRDNALDHGKELVEFLKITDWFAVEKYFLGQRQEAIDQGMFRSINLKWFYWQVGTFLLALALLFFIFCKSVSI